jgi:hypothetical protein
MHRVGFHGNYIYCHQNWSFHQALGWSWISPVSDSESHIYSPRWGWLKVSAKLASYAYWYEGERWVYAPQLKGDLTRNFSAMKFPAALHDLYLGIPLDYGQNFAPELLPGSIGVHFKYEEDDDEYMIFESGNFYAFVEGEGFVMDGEFHYKKLAPGLARVITASSISLGTDQLLVAVTELEFEFSSHGRGTVNATATVSEVSNDGTSVVLETFHSIGTFEWLPSHRIHQMLSW